MKKLIIKCIEREGAFLMNGQNIPKKKSKCIVKLNLGPKNCMYLKSLFPIVWSEFISEAITYDSAEIARLRLNERHYQLQADLYGREAYVECIEILTIVGGKIESSINYIGG